MGHCAFLGEIIQETNRRLGFEANPYDSCVVNKIINGTQCSVVWHVDEVRCSHVDPMVVENMIDMMSEEFGKDALL